MALKKTVQLSMLGDVPDEVVSRSYDFSGKRMVARILHLGAGVQSSTLAEMSVEGVLPPLDFAVFADTKNEPPWVYEQVEYLKTRLTVVTVEKSTGGIVEDSKRGHGRFATMPLFTRGSDGKVGRLKRQCTHEYKVAVIEDYLRGEFLKMGLATVASDSSRRVKPDVYVEAWFGISYDEAALRLKDRATAWSRDVYPLVDLRKTRTGCLDWLEARGLPVPWKSSCLVCPFHDDPYWLDLKTSHPALFAEACDYDDWLRSDEAAEHLTLKLENEVYLHRSCVPLREVDFSDELPPEGPLFCSAHCMT